MIRYVCIAVSLIVLSGCTIVRKYEEPDVKTMQRVQQQAYEAGVKDVLQDMKGKTQASERFVYQPPQVECGVRVPPQVIGGALYPAHETCVTVAPGQWVEQQPTNLPVIK